MRTSRYPATLARQALALAGTFLLALAMSSCGGGGDSTSPPPPPDNTVASVLVSPGTATVEVGATVQLSAFARNAAGTALNKSITWTADPASVATVSTSGLVTGVAVGSATVTASAEGRSGTATITVNQGTSQVIARGTIGPAGGTVAGPDIAVTIPAGAFTSARSIEILVDTDGANPFGTYGAAGEFRLNGFPSDQRVPVDIRLRATAALDGVSLIAYGTIVRTSDEAATPELRYRMTPARDSSGWLVATVSIAGKPLSTSWRTSPRLANVTAADAVSDLLDGLVTGVRSADTLSTSRFQVISYGAPRDQLKPLLGPTLQYVEEAYNAITQIGHSFAFRKTWPVYVGLHPMADHPDWYAFFNTEGPFPSNPETGFMEFNSLRSGETSMWPGVAIHELFHFMQVRYGVRESVNKFDDSDWFNEATSSWIMERAPSNLLAVKNTFFRGWRDLLFTGIHPGLTPDDGYSKGALIKYITDRWGDAEVHNVYIGFSGGASSMDAFLNAIPVPAATWWPEFLVAYMGNQVYSLAQDELVPGTALTGRPHPGWTFYQFADQYSLSASALRYTVADPAKLGTGTNLTLRFRTGDSTSFKLLGFKSNDAGAWTSLGDAADTIVVPGSVLKEGKKIVFFALRPEAVAPYTSQKSTYLSAELGITDGDWLADNIVDVNDGVVYTRTQEGDESKIDIADNVEEVARLLGSAGTWKHDKAVNNAYTWVAGPGVADTLAKYGIKLSSTLGLAPGAGYNWVLKSRLEFGAATAAVAPRQAAMWWYLLPLGFAPLLWRKRTRRFGAFLVMTATTSLWACDLGSILFAAKINYEFTMPEAAVQFTADAADSAVPALTYEGAAGKVVVEEYRSEYWAYTRDEQGNKVDSVKHVRTGAGTATFKADLKLHYDGKTPKDEDDAILMRRLTQAWPGAAAFLKR